MSVYFVEIVELNGDVQYSGDLLLELEEETTDPLSVIEQWLLEEWRCDGERAESGWVTYSCGTTCRVDTARRVSDSDAAVLSKYITKLFA